MRRIIIVLTAIFIICGFSIPKAYAQDFRFGSFQDWDWDDDWNDVEERRTYDLRYNRVEGIYLGGRIDEKYWRAKRPDSFLIYGHAGYAFSAREFQYRAALEQGIFTRNRLGIGAEYHRIIDTPDRWIIEDSENSLAAFFIREDYHDFYLREGSSVYVIFQPGNNLELYGSYNYDDFTAMEKNAKWSLFGGKKVFPDNPLMDEGQLRSIKGRVLLDTRNQRFSIQRGWYIELEMEKAGNNIGGEYTFDMIVMDLRRYQPMGYEQGIDIRLRAGTIKGDAPWQRTFHLGGLSHLRGFPYKMLPAGRFERGGNRMLLGQVEFRLGEGNLVDELDFGFFEFFNIILFADAGWVGSVDSDLGLFEGFRNLKWNDIKSSVGVALTNRSGSVRLELARRTDTGTKPFSLYFRVNRPF